MQFRLFKLRFRRRFRRGQKQVEDLGVQAEAGLEQHFFKRLGSLGKVWRFITAWVLLLVILAGCLVVQFEQLANYYQTTRPVAGGVYTEGVLGTFTNANPLFATTEADTTVSHLLFAGLFTYDSQNHLIGNLARSYDVDAKGTVYTVHLRPNLTWQDGQRLTASDVVFTYQAIQNPDARSPLASSWQGITVTSTNAYTVVFTLPNPLSSFPYTLTNGIIPKHAFVNLPATEWRSADFNTVHPIGAGPFKWDALQVADASLQSAQVLIALKPFDHYEGGAPRLDSFVVHTFTDQAQLITAFENHAITAIDGLVAVPASLQDDKSMQQYDLLLTAASMVFFNTANGPLADAQVRHALVQATDTNAIMSKLGYTTIPVREPVLKSQFAYDPAYVQAPYNLVQAKATLAADGWIMGKNGQFTKDGKPLHIGLAVSKNGEYDQVAGELKRQWQALGVQVDLNEANDADFQTVLASHNYDAVLYGISIGVDPDVFVYWHSSQIDPRSTRLNLSSYSSPAADTALEAGRTRLDPTLRAIKYKAFLAAWQQDAPAVGLYQPRFLYLTHVKVYGLDAHFINTDTDRFNNVQNWMIRIAKVTN